MRCFRSATHRQAVWQSGEQLRDYIHYGVTADATYNAYYDIYDADVTNLLEIEWNRTSTAGRVKNLAHFGNEDWQYWDASHNDVAAPVP